MAVSALTGGSGFLGLHLARRLLADGHAVRSLDVVPLDEELAREGVEGIAGDVRSVADVDRLCAGADVVVHAAAALPILRDRAEIRSVNVAPHALEVGPRPRRARRSGRRVRLSRAPVAGRAPVGRARAVAPRHRCAARGRRGPE